MVGKTDVAQRLCGSLQVDIEKTRRLLSWSPPLSLDEALRRDPGLRRVAVFYAHDDAYSTAETLIFQKALAAKLGEAGATVTVVATGK